MMCSSWKISIFGIVALMLSFGLMTADATAQVYGTVTVTASSMPASVRAASEIIDIKFEIGTGSDASDADRERQITINIPGGWTRPISDNGDEKAEAGEVEFQGEKDVTGTISGRNLIATVPKGTVARAKVTFTYKKVTAPARADSYGFEVTSNIHPGTVTRIRPVTDEIEERGSRSYLIIAVGNVESGKGEITVSGPSLYKHPEDVDPKVYKDKYLLTSKQSLGGLTFTLKATGTMIKDSTFSIDSNNGWGGFYPGPSGDAAGKATITGPATFDLGKSTAMKVVAKVTADKIEAGTTISIRIDGLEAPEVKENTEFIARKFTLRTMSRLAPDKIEDEKPIGSALDFITISAPGAGKIALNSNSVIVDDALVGRKTDGVTYAASEEELGELTFALTELEGFIVDGKIEIEIPAGFTPSPYRTFGDNKAAGTVTLPSDSHKLELVDRKITITVGATDDNAVKPGIVSNLDVTYNGVIVAPKAQGLYTFTTKTRSGPSRSGPHGTLTTIDSPEVDVVVGHGTGTMLLRNRGSVFSQTTAETAVGNLVFTYTPAGRMAKGAKVEITLPPPIGEDITEDITWTRARADNGDSVADAGEVALSGKADIAVTADKFTATATVPLTPRDRLVFTYKTVTVPKTAGSYEFSTRVISHGGADLNKPGSKLDPSPTVGVNQAADGSGSIAVNVTQADAGSPIGDIVFTYTATGTMQIGSAVEITLPSSGNWPTPLHDDGDANTDSGEVALSAVGSPTLSLTATEMTATMSGELNAGDMVTFTYKNIAAPTTGGPYTFNTKSKSSQGGSLTTLLDSAVTITIDEVAAGSVTLTTTGGALSSAAPGRALGNLVFTYTAGAQMANGAQVSIDIPAGWMPAFLDNNDGSDSAGEVSVAGAATGGVSGGGAEPWTVTATTNAVLEIGNTLTITYKMATAPSAEATYPFTTKSSVASGGTLLPISVQPTVIVRTLVTAIAIEADVSFFADESLEVSATLWSAAGGAANALGDMVVMLSSSSGTGSFSDADGNAITSVMIADNANSASASYSDTTAGVVTLTATSGELTASAVVTVKSTISNLRVNGKTGMMDESGMTQSVEVNAGDSITVTVVGTKGGGQVSVTQMNTDADGVVTNPPVVDTKSLDPDPHAVGVPAGSHAYTEVLNVSDLADGDYTVRVTIAGEDAELAIRVVTPRDPVTAITVAASADSFFAGDSIQVTVASDVRADEGGLEVTLSTDPADSGTFSMTEGGEATSTVTIKDAEDSMSAMVYYTNSDAGAVTLTATAGELDPASADVTVNDLVSSLQVNGMGEPDAVDAVAGNDTIGVSAIGKDGTATVDITDAEGEAVVSGVGLDKDADADVSEGSASYSRDIDLPDLADGDYTVTVTIAGGTKSIALEVMEPRDPVTAITVAASADSFFAGESIQVTVASDVRTQVGGLEVMLSTDPEDSGMFSMTEGGEATSTVTIPDAEDSMSAMVYYTNSTAGAVTLTATAGELSDSAVVTVKSTISNLQVNGMAEPDPVPGGASISVTATGKDGRSSVKVSDAEGESVVSGIGLDGVDDDEGNVAYSRDIALPSLEDGSYTVTVTIGSDTKSIGFEVLNDQTAPMLSEARARPVQAAYAVNEKEVVLSVNVARNTSEIAIASVTADVSALDSTLTGDDAAVKLAELPSGSGTYTTILTVSADNMHGDGSKSITFMATDRVGNESDPATAMVTLKNDQTAPTLTMASATPSPAANGTNVYISVSSESGLTTVTADASAIGGGMVTMMDANGNGANGMDTNGNGANGMNGMDANGNGGNGMNGMDANGNVMYTGMATVTDATDGAQMITITATDASGNVSDPVTVSVTVDNTGPMLVASVDSDMAKDGDMVTISVTSEPGLTDVTADASALGGEADAALTESADTAGTYSAMVTVTGATDGDQMVSITATDALGNASEAASVTVTVDNAAPALSVAAVTPDWATNGMDVTISVSTESGATVMANASAIGGAADEVLSESDDTPGMYSADVTVTGAMGGDQMVSISASDAIGNASEPVSATVSIHVVTSASFSPADVSTGDTVMVSAMGTAGLPASFSVFNDEDTYEGMLTESADADGSYSGSFDVVVDDHPTGTYWVTATIGQASMPAEGALTIDHKAQFDLAIAAGIHLIHVPLDVTHINGVEGTIVNVGDLYDALGDDVKFIISLGADGTWNSYLGDEDAGGVADAAIGDDTGLVAVMSSAASLRLTGNALGTAGTSAITLGAGNNLVGVPLDPVAGLSMISDALSHPLVTAVVVSNEAGNGFQTIAQPGDPGDGAIMGGVGYIVVAAATASMPIVGVAWDNTEMMMMADAAMTAGNGASTAPSIGFQTPVLQVQGRLIDVSGMMSRDGLNVTVRNLTRGTTLGSTTATDDYSMTFVKLDSSAAKVGDVIEINADSPNPLLGIRPVQHVVTADDVIDSRIDLPDLVTYEIPAQTELLANYPNPFNPETWIPYRLAEDGNVALSIYGASGSLVRTIDIGFTPAAVYEGRSGAIYWDGRNNFGEQVSSGIYFYHLNAGDFSATRKMVIVK